MGKLRIRDHKLPASAKSIKIIPLKKKNNILKYIILGLIISNAIFAELAYPGLFTKSFFNNL